VVAHIDQALNEYQSNRWGLFGLFESEDDQEVADALVEAAAGWLAERGRDRMVGPLSFSTKEDPGLLVEGNEQPPVVMQPWHPAYYRTLLEGAGMRKAKDVLWREVEVDRVPGDLLAQAERWAELSQSRSGVSYRRGGDRASLETVFRFMRPIFGEDWGYVPWTESELAVGLEMAIRHVGPGTMMAELDGELVGASMLVPDYNQSLRVEDGRVVGMDGEIDQARFMFMAVAPEYRHLGIMPALTHLHMQEGAEGGIKRVLIGWSYEDNEQMNVGMARLGLPVVRRHRIYEKPLDSSSPAGEPTASE
jgi:GNAT superfamily N-acetyltransferase